MKELFDGEYAIPEGYTASIENGKIIVKKELTKIEDKPVAIIPKFKVGDIIRHKEQGFTCKIIAIDTEYRLSECNGSHLPFEFQDFYELVEQKSAWSEDDEKAVNDIMWIIEAYRKNGFNETHIQIANNSENWLKSLKERYTWKPSDEQMKQLKSAANIYPDSRLGHALKSLYQDLMTYQNNLKL